MILSGVYNNFPSSGFSLNKSIQFLSSAHDVVFDGLNSTRFFSVNAVVHFENITFQYGLSPSGGAVSADRASLSFLGCVFLYNVASQEVNAGSQTYHGGGAIFASNTDVIVVDCVFVENQSKNVGGALAVVYNDTAALPEKRDDKGKRSVLLINGAQFFANQIDSKLSSVGSAVAVMMLTQPFNDTSITVFKSVFFGNNGTSNQGLCLGAFSVFQEKQSSGGVIQSQYNSFVNNTSLIVSGECMGGGLSFYHSDISVSDSALSFSDHFVDNSCVSTEQGNAMGGGMSVWFARKAENAQVTCGNAVITGNTINGRYSGIGGGVSVFLDNESNGTNVKVLNGYFDGNSAVSNGEGSCLGGGFSFFHNNRADSPVVYVSNTTFVRNLVQLDSSQEGDSLGGGVAVFFNSQITALSIDLNAIKTQYNRALVSGNQGLSLGGGCAVWLNESQTDGTGITLTKFQSDHNNATKCPNIKTPVVCT